MQKFINILSLCALVVVGLFGAWARDADATTEIFMILPELGDCGTSQDSQFFGHIEVFAFSFQGGNPGAGDTGDERATISSLQVTKPFDSCSPGLLLSTLIGRQFNEVRLEARTTGENPFLFLSILLEQVFVINYSSAGSTGEDRFLEQVALSFTRITLTQRSVDTAGRPRDPVIICYNVPEKRPC